MRYQLQSDSIGRISESLKQKEVSLTDESEKNQLKKEIYSLENRSKIAQQKADAFYEKARAYEKIATGNKSAKTQESKNPASEGKDSTISIKDNTFPVSPLKQDSNNPLLSKPSLKSEFKILTETPYKTIEDIPLDQPLPSGLIYRIQLGAFSKSVSPDRFKGIFPISGESKPNGITKYYAGEFRKNADAEMALNKVRDIGFKDAFITAYYNGQSISSVRAKELEKDNP